MLAAAFHVRALARLRVGAAPSEVTSSSERPSGSRTVMRSGSLQIHDDHVAGEELLARRRA